MQRQGQSKKQNLETVNFEQMSQEQSKCKIIETICEYDHATFPLNSEA